MISRRDVLKTTICGLLLPSAVLAEDGKKKQKKDNSGPAGAQDGKNEVKGAIWQIKAELAEGKKKEQFKFRVQDGVIFELQGGRKPVL